MTAPSKGRGAAAGVNAGLMEKFATAGMKIIRKPSQVGTPTSVGFATSAHAKCAFVVLQKIRGTYPVEPGGHPVNGKYLPSTSVRVP
jgi:hypothetical protein